MPRNSDDRPRLRPVEAFRIPDASTELIGVRDVSGLSDVVLTMSLPALHLLSMMDGTLSCADIRARFEAQFGQPVAESTLQSLIEHLEKGHFLEGPVFEDHYNALQEGWRQGGIREMPHATDLGIHDATGAPFVEMLADAAETNATGNEWVRGIIAPHLDYPRGRPAYAAAYRMLVDRPKPDRVVILGTNHFGRSCSVVGTGADFVTPLGRTRCDRAFLEKLESRCGDLRRYELDHVREHSVELQVAWLQHLFGADSFKLVAFLCPDPCGPTGTAPADGQGVDLEAFAEALAAMLNEEDADTLLVAGADLSHVGAQFGDEQPLDEAFLTMIDRQDRSALHRLCDGDAAGFVAELRAHDNRTRVCSAGCIFVLASALPGAAASLLRYHQAVDPPSQTCVSCAAVAFV